MKRTKAKPQLPTGNPLPSVMYRRHAIDRRPLTNTRGPIIVWTVLDGAGEIIRDTAPNAEAALERAQTFINNRVDGT